MERLLMFKIIKDCMGKPKNSYQHELKRGIFTFMFKINVKFPQLLCLVAQNCEF